MISFLKRVLFFSQRNTRFTFWLSFVLVSGSCLFAFYVNNYLNELGDEFQSYKKEFLSTKKLQKAKRILNADPCNSEEFVKLELEEASLLTHIKHHHENSLNPSVPVAFDPKENRLLHNKTDFLLKGLKRTQFSLIKSVYMDEEDLKHLFSLTEEKSIFPFQVPSKAPFLFFTKFHIKKHPLSLYENVFEIDYKLESLSL